MTRKPPAPLSVWRTLNHDRFLLGAPHYPEHVDESYWQRDAERLAAAGANTVRTGEFAWHIWEPVEGKFSFDLFDRAIEVLWRTGIKTVLCTPTATPPRWLTVNCPEVLRVDGNGRRAMARASRPTPPARFIAPIRGGSPGRWPGIAATIRMSWAGRPTTS